MPDETRHESADLEDYQVMDSSDTLDDAPGDDPLDRGVIPPAKRRSNRRAGPRSDRRAPRAASAGDGKAAAGQARRGQAERADL